ncbi:unnamed protein product [Rotaria sordida]|uniref:Peptidase S1 domain-containing protein n=1 Tax=Rotaria sordida TaxID=392033 RepID=A0A819HV14_9BILA|nr:unnamed protein product [Rotaria sordida]
MAVKDTNESRSTSTFKIIGLIWIVIETNLVAGNIFGFGSLFSVLPHYGIYESRCKIISEKIISNDTKTITKDCRGQIDEYQFAFALGIGFYNLPAVVVGMIADFFGPRSLKMIAIVFHLISWFSLAFLKPGYDWLILSHTIFSSLAGMCVLLSSFSISANFTKTRGLVTALISGAQIGGSVWYANFQILIEKNWISLSTLAFIWASFSILMFGSAMLFLNWHSKCANVSNKRKLSTNEDVAISTSDDSLARHLTDPIFVVVTLFLSCLLLTVAYLPVVWFPWVLHLTGHNLHLANRFTFAYNMSAILSIFIAPICGLIIDYKADQGRSQRMLNISILQTITWLATIILCIVCMFRSIAAPIAAILIFLFSRTMLVAGCQAVITTRFPPQYIGSLLGVMWTTAGIVSFVTYGLTRLATNPIYAWRNADPSSSLSINVPSENRTERVVYISLPSIFSRDKISSSSPSCKNCFHFRTIKGGSRMLIDPCGEPDCVPIIKSPNLQEIEPTEKYDFEQCGIFDKKDNSIVNKALQLKVSTSVKNTLRPAEYPWLVRIESRSDIFSRTVTLCAGTLIHPQWIITAAHCMFDTKKNSPYATNGITLYMGHYDRSTSSLNEHVAKPILYLIHPKFRLSILSPAPIHDIALIKLEKPVPLSHSIGIACLPERTDKLADGTLAFTAGWGHSSPDSTAVNIPRKARLKVAPKSCRNLMINHKLHICGRNDRGNNICSGDSGAGLMIRAGIKLNRNRTQWKWYIFGVASYGLEECSQNVNHDNAFASVSTDIDWIDEVIDNY